MPSGALAVAATEIDGFRELLISAVGWTLAWISLFYILVFSEAWWSRGLQPSTKPHENDRYWCARSVLGIIHALFVSCLSVPALFVLLDAPERVQFAASNHLANCKATDPDLIDYTLVGMAVALAGLAFTTFTLADLILSSLHGLHTLDYVIHHIAFFTAGMIIRSHCMLPLNAAVLMSMEVSTPFLNIMTMLRHRGETYKSKVIVTGILFIVTFFPSRIVLNLYGTVKLWVFQVRGLAMPPKVPMWQAWFLVLAVTAGATVQVFWLPGICSTFTSRLAQLCRNGDCNIDEEENGKVRLLSACDA